MQAMLPADFLCSQIIGQETLVILFMCLYADKYYCWYYVSVLWSQSIDQIGLIKTLCFNDNVDVINIYVFGDNYNLRYEGDKCYRTLLYYFFQKGKHV